MHSRFKSDLQQAYQQALQQELLQPNAQQAALVNALHELTQRILSRRRFKKLFSFKQDDSQQGLYIWGKPGIGKTYLMNLFFNSLPTQRKIRMHFYQFMQTVHLQLRQLQDQRDPLKIIAREFSLHADVICFDEFFVNDIADAMILTGLLQALLARHVNLVITSNVAPNELYKNGLQRSQFLPAIKLLQTQLQVIHVDIDQDYRQQKLLHECLYLTPLNAQTQQTMDEWFQRLTANTEIINDDLIIDGRRIKTLGRNQKVIAFEFSELCAVPRSQSDYLAIARQFTTVMLSNVPQIREEQESQISYFIALIDILYDSRINLIISAAVDIDAIYPQGRKTFEFARTRSRLHEMHQLPAVG